MDKAQLFAPLCSITTTKRRRFFWAAWWSAPPTRVPFRKPDASDGGAATFDEALAAAERAAGVKLAVGDPEWARAWMRSLRGQPAWPSGRAFGDARARARGSEGARKDAADADRPASIWKTLGVGADATLADIARAFKKRALELHPDHGGDPEAFRRLVRAYEEARKRARRPKRRT